MAKEDEIPSTIKLTVPSSPPQLDYIRLDVGGYLFVCHRTTLLKYPDSVLAKLVAPEYDKRTSNAEFITIDRNGKHFGIILDYIRDENTLDLTMLTYHDLVDIQQEADYYNLIQLVELCCEELNTKKELNDGLPDNIPLYMSFEKLVESLKKRKKQETVVILDIMDIRNCLSHIKLKEIFELCYPLPVYACIFDEYNAYNEKKRNLIIIFHDDDIKLSFDYNQQERVLCNKSCINDTYLRLYKFLANLRKDYIK